MSEAAPEAPASLDLAPQGVSEFATLMAVLAPEEAAPAAPEGGAPADGAPAGDGPAAPADQGAPAAAGTPAPPAAGGGGEQAAPDGTPAPAEPAPAPAGDRPAAWTAPAAELIPKLGELSTAFEDRVAESYKTAALEEVRTEHKEYFEALEKHPRLLIGQKVPAVGKEGHEVLRDASDAKDWQDAVKSVLLKEVQDRAGRKMEESTTFLDTVHASIDLFKNNVDLIPGTQEFDTELANRFASLAQPYELRNEAGKLQGYSIPVQPIINQLRTQLASERAKAPAAPAAAPEAPAAVVDPPQAGIPSKAGDSSSSEDFSTLFGTIGLPGLRI